MYLVLMRGLYHSLSAAEHRSEHFPMNTESRNVSHRQEIDLIDLSLRYLVELSIPCILLAETFY